MKRTEKKLPVNFSESCGSNIWKEYHMQKCTLHWLLKKEGQLLTIILHLELLKHIRVNNLKESGH